MSGPVSQMSIRTVEQKTGLIGSGLPPLSAPAN
ncbi:hypothetical protein J2778_005399 [Paraburkholderia graminis]|uniref:Uncharacterized protein n=1 Tax=Paraburkholderia graminis TaxID=60548 RepID=A0ABD5CGE1_9BURK|nr:hypothetical protein [Paraburkholderia graminis]MDR6204383.1 hypothetical protein [Paraburkholderia graminis]MDR6477894.1 hypothetical protein [Paraburkholderia graminis]